ncbi:unnamed protein product [Urochloa humidicola]
MPVFHTSIPRIASIPDPCWSTSSTHNPSLEWNASMHMPVAACPTRLRPSDPLMPVNLEYRGLLR